ncbi:hypothetical protein [Geomonas propionica]|uniref:Uncharacterized protein n=1 Tax=Geomonas propionica TaxID=2798582 RepID=A0ABS0YMW6_9BACT|nr:hypothetical protein [Geomonas propionica]MBJ6799323.1 hypothetical protein [Geomonas propionica]
MLHLKFDLSGKPAVFISNCKRYYNGLSGLSLYRNPPDQAISLAKLKEVLDLADQKYQDAVNFDRVQILLRNNAFKELIDMFKRIEAYLQLVATEAHIPELAQAGIIVAPPVMRRKKAPSPATS